MNASLILVGFTSLFAVTSVIVSYYLKTKQTTDLKKVKDVSDQISSKVIKKIVITGMKSFLF